MNFAQRRKNRTKVQIYSEHTNYSIHSRGDTELKLGVLSDISVLVILL